MRSTGVLGGIALVAILIAAMCFAVVDATTTAARLCEQTPLTCVEPVFGPYVGWFAVGGAVALVACIVPAVLWLTRILRRPGPSGRGGDVTGA